VDKKLSKQVALQLSRNKNKWADFIQCSDDNHAACKQNPVRLLWWQRLNLREISGVSNHNVARCRLT